MKEFFLICALALPVPLIHDSFNKDSFLREYNWIKSILEKAYPGSEFKIVPNSLNITHIPGWERLDGIYWNGHSIFRRPKPIPPEWERQAA